jgi:4-hydroxythreonine-4-phosphate dehydrogenase
VKNKPVVAITMGDFNGIGPEVITKTLTDKKIFDYCLPVLIGSLNVFQNISISMNSNINLEEIQDPVNIKFQADKVSVINIVDIKLNEITHGIPTNNSLQCSFEALKYGINLAKQGKIDGLVTGPISKNSLSETKFPGQTEFIASEVDRKEVLMLMVANEFKVGLVTTHTGIRNVPDLLNRDLIISKLKILNNTLIDLFEIQTPKIAVCSLNPHAGDNGLFGGEEQDIILPAVNYCIKQKMRVTGPLPADTVFIPEIRKGFDAVLAMYHDQGLIPFKSSGFKGGVNLSAGLPLIRTSPIHGTAYDIAPDFIADAGSMKEAIILNAKLCRKNRS